MLRHRAALVAATIALLVTGGLVGTAHAAGRVTATFARTSVWASGYQAQYTVTNGTGSSISSWTVGWDLPAGTTMGTYWDALVTTTGTHTMAANRTYNGTVAPGASVVFGFVVSGTGLPTGCTVNGASCDGAGPSPTPTVSPTGPPPVAGPLPVAPYIDMGAWPTPVLSDEATQGYSLGFVTASACKAMWFNAYDPRTGWQKDEIDKLRARGGDVKVSFGGASGAELAQACTDTGALTAEYQAVVTAYQLKYVDFDIEGAAIAEPASIARRNTAMANLQRANPGLKVSLTLPVLPEGLTTEGLNVVRTARDAGVNLDLVNIMAMDYYRDGDYGGFAVQAAQSTFTQLKALYPAKTDAQVWKMVGVTPMLGKNDDGRVYDQADARQLVAFAQSRHLGMLAFWEATRDRNACTGPLYRCTNIPQSPYEFSKIFAGYAG
ncbi:hypothetical protein Lfu02_34040 [Longispora fulva]|uniref:CBM2 domain-containing protein n=1 Tax=Longispora fulva TaxID=619741 RepID=A0A8J7GK32_9ACTN|nr:cellulose binding domain-containing protein [Longispora fulva]MBG6141813.1 hypothetical protein [Longispora fulva]GIG59032.1 hypothetical protein Lfu02_34040 [Longispora fulva]